METVMKFCNDCEHFGSSWRECMNPKYATKGVDEVSGKPWEHNPSASICRSSRRRCGMEAKGFEPKASKKSWLERVIAYFK